MRSFKRNINIFGEQSTYDGIHVHNSHMVFEVQM